MIVTRTNLMALVIAFASLVDAHMSIVSPIPYGHSTPDAIKVPITSAGFPCHHELGVLDDNTPSNVMAIGAPQVLAFRGSATHGGGSCQISLTKDKKPTKDSKFLVIHSIIGGCPFNSALNMGDDANALNATKFPFKIPDGFDPGDYTLAWSWHNRIGNREMYMNCAPVTITGTNTKPKGAAFPEIFKANIDNGCTTVDQVNGQSGPPSVIYPDPGPSVEKITGFPTADPVGGAACGVKSSSSPPSGSDESNAAGPAAPESAGSNPNAGATPVASPPASAPTAIAPVVSPIVSPLASAPAAASIPASAPAAPIASAAPVAPTVAGSGSGASGNGSVEPFCSAGKSICSPDGKQIGTCDTTGHVTFVTVASGTICQGGYMVMAGSKRSAKFRQGHIRRGHSLGRW